MRIELRRGDCIVRMQDIGEAQLYAVVSDPPYGLEFMRSDDDWKETWKYGIRKVGWKGFGALPTFTASRNPVCRTCHKHMRGSKNHKACECDLPDYDQTEHRIRDRRAYQAWCKKWLAELFRVVQPEGRVVLFGGTRMYHRMAVSMEEVGFTDLELAGWCYFNGFPKSHNISRSLEDRGHPEAAQRWGRYGTALKPAWEPVVLAIRP